MAQRNVDRMPADDLWRDWQADVERIRRDTVELFSFRRQFRELQEIFARNGRLQETGGHIWEWIRVAYTWTVLARLRREAMGEGSGVSLRQLLEEIERRPDVVTRARVLSATADRSELLQRVLDQEFTDTWIGRPLATYEPTDAIERSIVTADKRALIEATDRLVEVVSRTVAHRSRVEPETLKVREVDAVFDVIEQTLQKYLTLLTGRSWVGFEPSPVFNTIAPFTFPWHEPFFRPWQAMPDDVKRRAGLYDLGDEGVVD